MARTGKTFLLLTEFFLCHMWGVSFALFLAITSVTGYCDRFMLSVSYKFAMPRQNKDALCTDLMPSYVFRKHHGLRKSVHFASCHICDLPMHIFRNVSMTIKYPCFASGKRFLT
jgi:hypothetical protein